MVEPSTVKDQELNIQPTKVSGDENAHTSVSIDPSFLSVENLTNGEDELTDDIDEVLNTTENFAMELTSQRKFLKLRNKKKNQKQKKSGISGATSVELRDLVDETVTILPRDVSSHNLRQEDDIIKVNIDTSNDGIESSVDASTDIDMDINESSTNESAKTGVDNIPTRKSKKGKKKKVKKARSSLNSTGSTDSLNQSTLDSILVGIEEYLQDDNSKDDEDIKVNVIKDEVIEDKQTTDNEVSKISCIPLSEKRFDEGKENIETVKKSTQEILNADVINTDHYENQYRAGLGEVERATSQEHNDTLNTGKESIDHHHKPRSLDEEKENTEIATADSLLQSGTKIAKTDTSAMDGFHSNTGKFKGSDLEEGRQTDTAQKPEHPLNVELKDEDKNKSHALELQTKGNEKPVTANHKKDENVKKFKGIVSKKDTTLEEDPIKKEADIDNTAYQTGCTSEDELQDNAVKVPLEAVKNEKENSTSQELETGNTTEQPAAVKNNKVSGIEEGSSSKKDMTSGGYKEKLKTGYDSIARELEGNAKFEETSEKPARKDSAEVASKENEPKEHVILEMSRVDTEEKEVETAEALKGDTNGKAFSAAEALKEDTKVHGAVAAKTSKEDAKVKGVETAKEAKKTEDARTSEPIKESTNVKDADATKQEAKGDFTETNEAVREAAQPENGKDADASGENTQTKDPEVAKEDAEAVKEGVKSEDVKVADTEDTEATEAIKATDATEAIKAAKSTDATEAIKAAKSTDATEAIKAAKSTDATEAIKAAKATDATDAIKATDATEAAKTLEEDTKEQGVEVVKKCVETEDVKVEDVKVEDTKVEDAEAAGALKEDAKEKGVKTVRETMKSEETKVEADETVKDTEAAKALEKDTEGQGVEAVKIGVKSEDTKVEDAKVEDAKVEDAEALEEDAKGQNVEDNRAFGEGATAANASYPVKPDESFSKEDTKARETEEGEMEDLITDLTEEGKLEKNTKDHGDRETETIQEEVEICGLDFTEEAALETREASFNGEDRHVSEATSQSEKAKEVSEEPTADDIFKDIMDETDEFLEQLKIVDDSEINALLQSLEGKDTKTQNTKTQNTSQNTQDQAKVQAQAVIKTSEIRKLNEQEPVYIYTSLAGGGFHMIPRTNRLSTILTANRVPFTYRDLGTDDEARKVWKTFSKGRSLPGVVRGRNDLIGNWEDVEEANEDYKLRELIYDTM